MALFNFFKKQKPEETEVKKSVLEQKSYTRPAEKNYLFQNAGNGYGRNSNYINKIELYEMYLYSDILQNVILSLKTEIFRNGFSIDAKTEVEDETEKEKIENVLKSCNENNQPLIDVLGEIEIDLDVLDDAYLFLRKNYFYNDDGEVIGSEVQEVLRVDPLSINIIFDESSRIGYVAGKPQYVSINDRSTLVDDKYDPETGLENIKACYSVETISYKNGKEQNISAYYDTQEILHVSKFRPSKLYGFSPLMSLYNKVMTLINMDTYMRLYYSGNKTPKGILTVNTSNSESFWKWWDKFIEDTRRNPHSLTPLIHQTGPDNKDFLKWNSFMNNLQEMQYTETRNEMRQQIGAIYNVAPIFQNDLSAGGGLNNEGLQITVTNRGVENGQRIHNEKLLPFIFDQMGITMYDVKLLPSEEEDELAEKELRLKELAIAKATAELGITVNMNATGDFTYEPGEVELETGSQEFAPFMERSAPVEKALKPTVAQVKEVENALVGELDKILKQFDLKTKPNEAQLNKMVDKATKDLDKAIKTKNANKIKGIYKKAMGDVGKNVGEKFTLTDVDKNVIEALKRDPVYDKAFAGIKLNVSSKLKDVIKDAYKQPGGLSISAIVKNMSEELDATQNQLQTIARTETTKISVAARKTSLDKTGAEYKYFHIGPSDNRTSDMSKKAKDLTKDGVSWNEYVDIITKVAKEHNGPNWKVNPEAPITHPNTRHVFNFRRV